MKYSDQYCMNYYTETNYIDHDELRTAGSKGRDDYFEVLRRCGLKCIRIPVMRTTGKMTLAGRVRLEMGLRKTWRQALSGLGEGDTLILHSPISEKFMSYPDIIEELHDRGCRIIDIVFDLETFFRSDYRHFARIKHEGDRRTEARLFEISDAVICHNEKMKDRLVSIGVDAGKILCVGVMDYLMDESTAIIEQSACTETGGRHDSAERNVLSVHPEDDICNANTAVENTLQQINIGGDRCGLRKPIVFCSNLDERKSGFVYRLTEEPVPGLRLDMYGPGYTGNAPLIPGGASDNNSGKNEIPAAECNACALCCAGVDFRGGVENTGRKAGKVNDQGHEFPVCGVDNTDDHDIRYRGVYTPEELMNIMEGSFGLVWDGSSVETCIGACGEYLRYNNPHKMSHYLAGGMPVLIWKDAALVDFVKEEGCGLEISSIAEIPALLRSITEEEYEEMCINARRVGAEMRKGVHIQTAVTKALGLVE